MRTFVASIVAVAAISASAFAQPPAHADSLLLGDMARRLQAYVDLKGAVADTVLPLVSLREVAEVQRRTDALATVIRSARSDARQGDIFTPQIAQLIRRAIRDGCEGDYLALLALIREEQIGPLPPPVIHARWPAFAPVPTMLPGLLAALPPLPGGLQYRFINTALVLIDIDANLIIDFVPDAIPITTVSDDAH